MNKSLRKDYRCVIISKQPVILKLIAAINKKPPRRPGLPGMVINCMRKTAPDGNY